MSKNFKVVRAWKKQEKRIVLLLYRKGLLSIPIENLYWAEYTRYGKKFRSKYSKIKWECFLPEIYYSTWDYWSGCNEHPLVDDIIDRLIYNGIPEGILEKYGYDYSRAMRYSSFQYKGRKWFIKYLSSLPTVRKDSKINKFLKYTRE
jgi:hypothetical protein